MNTILSLLLFLWLLRITANVLSYVHLWWVKEYRFDRMFIHLRTKQGRRIFFIPFRLPPISPKTVVLALITISVLSFLFFTITSPTVLVVFFLDLLTFPLTSLMVGILQVPTFFYHQLQILRAVRKLRAHKNLRVVGITGSFGKTSTKEYLATILATKYKVLKTEASKNSAIGIAEIVLAKLTPSHELFVVEMGAYKQGEIAQMAQMVRPQVGIVTAINPQHQDLFGSLDATMKAKYELISEMPPDSVAICNGDDERVRTIAEWAHGDGKKVWFYTRNHHKLPEWTDNIISAENIKVGQEDLAFTLRIRGERINLSARVLGEHQVSNILAAAACAWACGGMTLKDIAKGVAHIKPYTKTMQPEKSLNGATFINDTFNNNPDAARAALNFLAKTRGKKILVFQPMIELGEFAAEAHERVGCLAAQVCDEIFLTNDNFREFFERGVLTENAEKKVTVASPVETAGKIKQMIGKGDTVLFKGKEAENVLKLLK